MRSALLLICFALFSLSAPAQWWKVSLKKHLRYPLLATLTDHSVERLPAAKLSNVKIQPLTFSNTGDYYLEIAEADVMRTAQHNMRFRIYNTASYNFSTLAELYIKQNRFSEAKWYLLQSNNISRQQNDDKHTIANLMDLAMVKANLGQLLLAQQDLAEARQIAALKGWTANVSDIDKESGFILRNKISLAKTELRYADAVLTDKKTD